MSGARKLQFTLALLTGVAPIALAPPAVAQLSGLSVAAGQATLSTTSPGASVIRQTTEKAVLNWQSFSIASGNSLQFIQPNAAAIALNRVFGPGASAINGSLTANGQVWIVNPNGVMFGPGASVNVAGLLATTADIRDQDFLAGNYSFGIPSPNANAGVVNLGAIRVANGGSAVLAAPIVQNQGLIQASLGSVVLGGTPTFTVDFQGDKLISFQVPQPSGNGSQVINGGTISAAGGSVLLTARAARDVLTNVINTTGMISATTASLVDGEIVLDAGPNGAATVSGTLDASGKAPGQTGGTVEVLGGSVALASGASINASGAAGGGTVLIGGNLHGAGPLPNSQNASIAAGASVTVDALTNGNGGTVALWSDAATSFGGAISARGGAQGGNGGFIETSSTGILTATGSVNALAPQGQAGTWLLDPIFMFVQPGGTATLAQVSAFDPTVLPIANIDPGTIDAAQANVVLDATLQIFIRAPISMTSNGVGIAINAGQELTLNPGGSITTRGGSITLTNNTGPTPDPSGSINIAADLSTAGGGQSGGSITLNGTAIALGGNLTTIGGAVTLNGSPTISTNVTVATGGGNILIGGAINGTDGGGQSLTLNAGTGSVALNGAIGNTDAPTNLTIQAGAPVTLPATTLAGNLTVTAPGIAATGTLTVAGTATLAAGSGAITVAGAVSDLASLAITSSGSSIFSGAVDVDGGVSLAASAGDVQFLHGLTTGAASSFLNTGNLQIGSGAADTSSIFGALTHTTGATTLDGKIGADSVSVAAASLGGAITTANGQSYGAATLTSASTLTDTGNSGIAFTSTLAGGGFNLALTDAQGTATFSGNASGLGALDTTAASLARFNGTLAGASAKFGAVTFAGGGVATTGNQSYAGSIGTLAATTLSASGTNSTITISGASTLNDAFALNLLAGGSIAINGSLQQSGAGGITLVAGWDGATAANQAANHSGAFGLHSGNVTIGSGATGNVAVGSAGGLTTVAAANLTISATDGYAQLGFHGPATGGITVNLTGGLALNGGTTSGAAAQIGHGGTQVAGNFSGDINIAAAGNVALTAGSGSEAYVQVGHGGAQSNQGATTGFSETANISIQGNAVTLNGNGNNASYAQIGNGGFQAGLDAQISSGSILYSGNISVTAAGALSLTAGGSNSYAQIGNGGDQANVDAHLIGAGSVINLAGQITVSSGTSASQGAVTLSADDYAQIGNGGWSANTGATASNIQESGDINITVTDGGPSSMNAGNKSIGYVQVGNGDATQTGFGNVSGNIFMTMGNPTLNDGTANAPITMGNATAPGFNVSGATFLNGQLFGVTPPAPPPPEPPPPVVTPPPPPPPPVEPPPVVVIPPPEVPPPVVVVEIPPPSPPPSSGPIMPNNNLAEFINLNANGTSGLNSLLLSSLSFTDTTPISGTSTTANGQVNDSTASLLNSIQPGAGADTGGIGQIEALTERTGGASTSGFGPGGQETDTVASSITQSLGGTPGVINAVRTSANQTMIAGLLYEAGSPLASRYAPRAVPSVDEVYSSWGNEAFWQ